MNISRLTVINVIAYKDTTLNVLTLNCLDCRSEGITNDKKSNSVQTCYIIIMYIIYTILHFESFKSTYIVRQLAIK